MTGITYSVDTQRIQAAANRMAARLATGEVQGEIAGLLKSQTQRRLRETKTAPDGTPWAEWSEDYAATRGPQHSLLQGEGDLDDDLMTYADARSSTLGSPLIYAAIQQFGGEEVGIDIPAREYLGLSDDNAREIEQAVEDWLQEGFR